MKTYWGSGGKQRENKTKLSYQQDIKLLSLNFVTALPKHKTESPEDCIDPSQVYQHRTFIGNQ
jgi:hypothetical protein